MTEPRGVTGVSVEQLGEAAGAGFDFAELDAMRLLGGDMSSKAWDPSAPDPATWPLPVRSVVLRLPVDLPATGPDRDRVGLQDLMQRLSKRAERLGIGAIRVDPVVEAVAPAALDRPEARLELAWFLDMAASIARHHGVKLTLHRPELAERAAPGSTAHANVARAPVPLTAWPA